MKSSASSQLATEGEGNIQVVVRCRGLSPSEIAQSLPLVATAAPTRGTTIQLLNPSSTSQTPSSTSSTLTQITKTYDFGDRPTLSSTSTAVATSSTAEGSSNVVRRGNVFGPEADQGMVWMDVAKPILGQVLAGYNCTIFAYGQTGTGKTYTMEGDLTPYHGTFSPSAGLIPRTLFSLFSSLSSLPQPSDYSVRCSYIELYNEELRDLNALDWEETLGKGRNGDGLKIYEEGKGGSGCSVMGLEETFIASAEEGLKVLKRGGERRQVAATRCNEQSSRSHSIFTLTIHIRETSKSTGEELLKVGKLNLVDLAGSENVGRSGAKEARAREAGMINVSLLALGRVITCLVEKKEGKGGAGGHIPYRESKLTRLLQDSLGGRTRTTIIATISPVNFDETVSTLDYAQRARTIQNRPEVNQKMTKMALLAQYANELEKLKEDLVAAREKNGVYLSTATWEDLQSASATSSSLLSELQKQLEIADSSLESTRAQFEQNLQLLGAREDELKKVQDGFEVKRRELEGVVREWEGAVKLRREEMALREAFEKSRKGWMKVAGEERGDVEGLRAKIERKRVVEAGNRVVLGKASVAVHSTIEEVDSKLEAFAAAQADFASKLQEELETYAQERASDLDASTTFINERLTALTSSSQSLLATTGAIESRGSQFLSAVEEARRGMLELSATTSQMAADFRKEHAAKLTAQLTRHSSETVASVSALIHPILALEAPLRATLLQDEERIRQIAAADQAALVEENDRLKALVAHLTTSLEQERQASADEDAEIVALLATKLEARSRRAFGVLHASHARAREDAEYAVAASAARAQERGALLADLNATRLETSGKMQALNRDVQENAKRLQGDFRKSVATVQEGVTSYQEVADASVISHTELIEATAKTLEESTNSYGTNAGQLNGAVKQGLLAMVNDTHETYRSLQADLAAVRVNIGACSSATSNAVSENADAVEGFAATVSEHLTSLQASMRSYLDTDIKADIPTGQTPRKRAVPQDDLHSIVDLDGEREQVIGTLLDAGYAKEVQDVKDVVVELLGEPIVKESKSALTVLKGGVAGSLAPKSVLGQHDGNRAMRRSTVDHSLSNGARR